MRRLISYLLILALFAGIVIPAGRIDAASKLKVAKKKVTVRVKESVKVKYTSDKKPKVTSKNKKIAKAKVKGKNIVITGVKKGTTNVTAKAAGKKAVIKVTVKKKKADTRTDDGKENVATATPAPTTDPQIIASALNNIKSYSTSMNQFSCSTFDNLKSADGNTFVSPFSLYMALAMAVNGADGNTKAELLSAMGIDDFSKFNDNVKGVLLGSSDEKVILNIANGAWIGNSFEMSPNIDNDFIYPIKEYYNGEVKKGVQMDSQKFIDEVNQWADSKTNGLIKKMLEKPLPANTAAVLANAVYFLGDWKYPFDDRNTIDREFNGTAGKKNVPAMSRGYVYGNYFKNDNFVGASIPYGKGNYAMDILMSADSSTTVGKLWDGLSVEEQCKVLNMFSDAIPRKFDYLQLPKFELSGDFESDKLIGGLVKLGVKDAFDPDKADFNKIGKKVYIGEIIQKTKLKVNEKGSEAAAVTVVRAASAAAPPTQPVEKLEFIVDRPFIFTIRDTISGTILFIGEVNNL